MNNTLPISYSSSSIVIALLRDSNGSASTTFVAFDSHDLVVKRTQRHAELSPCVEVVGRGDGSAGALLLTDRQELNESLSALNRWRVGASVRVDVVGPSVAGDGSHVGTLATGVVGTVGFDDVVLVQRTGGPAVDGKEAISAGCEVCGAVCDGSAGPLPVSILVPKFE